ncbi:hypothetical protein D3C72_2457550 [compost metagenome]
MESETQRMPDYHRMKSIRVAPMFLAPGSRAIVEVNFCSNSGAEAPTWNATIPSARDPKYSSATMPPNIAIASVMNQ